MVIILQILLNWLNCNNKFLHQNIFVIYIKSVDVYWFT
jgi:hypothetical protein